MPPFHGQVQPITLVLITGIIISLVSAAYIWGVPVLQKRTAVSAFNSGLSFMLSLDEKITRIANEGGGKESIKIPSGTLRVVPYDSVASDANTIYLEVFVEQPMLVTGQEAPLKTSSTSEPGVFGVDEPRILTVKQEREGNIYKIIFKMHYRELLTTTGERKGFQIGLSTPDTSPRTERAAVSFEGRSVLTGQASNGGDLFRTVVNVEVT